MLSWIVLKPAAVLALVVGAIALPTPLPLGAPLIAVGLAILIATSSTMRGRVRGLRHRSPRLDALMAGIEPLLGRRLGTALRRTRPLRTRPLPVRPRTARD